MCFSNLLSYFFIRNPLKKSYPHFYQLIVTNTQSTLSILEKMHVEYRFIQDYK